MEFTKVKTRQTIGLILFAAFIFSSCEIPTDGKFGGGIRGGSVPHGPSLAAPKNVRAVEGADNGTVAVTWDEVQDADGYNVYRSKGPSSQVSLRGGVSRAGYTDSGKSVAPNTPYYYFVSAYNGEVESALSPSAVVELSAGDPGILPAPEITGAGIAPGSENSIRLTWTTVPDASQPPFGGSLLTILPARSPGRLARGAAFASMPVASSMPNAAPQPLELPSYRRRLISPPAPPCLDPRKRACRPAAYYHKKRLSQGV
jgi:hypothetical protein